MADRHPSTGKDEADKAGKRSSAGTAQTQQESLIAEIKSKRESISKRKVSDEEKIHKSLARLEQETKDALARYVITGFIFAIFAVILFIFTGPLFIFSPDVGINKAEYVEKFAAQIIELLSSVFLPVVTLVIGYYFGAKSTDNTDNSGGGD